MTTSSDDDAFERQEADDVRPWIEEHELRHKVPHLCPECGNTGACGFDAEGRPYVHIIQDRDDGGEFLLLSLWGGSFW